MVPAPNTQPERQESRRSIETTRLSLPGKKNVPPGNHTIEAAPLVPSGTLPVPDDLELMQQIGRGDERAFEVLVDRHARYLYGIAHGLAGNTADAEDLVQETFT